MTDEVTTAEKIKNKMIDKVEQLVSKNYSDNSKTEFLSLGCVGTPAGQTDSGIRSAIELCFVNGVAHIKTLSKFKALGSWQQANAVDFKNISLPFSYPDNKSVTGVAVAFLLKDKHFTTCIVVMHGTGLTSFYETNISLV